MSLPLDGIRVLDLSHVIAGPFASFYLAQLGAEVIKVESPFGGDIMRSTKPATADGTPHGFVALNAGKRSLAIDIRTPEGAEVIRALARKADVFIENFRPGVVAKYGLDYASIAVIKPEIVYCSISGYGQDGQWARRGAYDHVVQALTGMMMMGGESDEAPPVKVGFPVVDVAVGMLGALSISAALHRRDREGQGQYIDASMVQAALTLMYPDATRCLNGGGEPPRVGNRGHSGSPTADTYRCTDGWLAIAANTPAQFRKLTQLLGCEELCADAKALDLEQFNAEGGGFVVARDLDYLRNRFRDALAVHSAAAMETALNEAGIPAARVRRIGEFLQEIDDTQAVQLQGGAYRQADGRTIKTTGLGYRNAFNGELPSVGAESLGQSTRELLLELGLAAEQIESLATRDALKAAPHKFVAGAA